jgi:hypothetical protein
MLLDPEDLAVGMQMTSEEARSLEEELQSSPADITVRTRLLGYYAGAMFASEDMAGSRAKHALWLIENAPDAGITGSVFCRLDEPEATAAARAWDQHLVRRPNEPNILAHAARFFQYSQPKRALELILKAQELAPGGGWKLEEEDPPRDCEVSCSHAETNASAERNRLDELRSIIIHAVNNNDRQSAKSAATELLALASTLEGDLSCGDATYLGHHTLGCLAVADGDIAEASGRLLSAAGTPGSPVLGSFGPDMTLARALLERGEHSVVLLFLEKCHEFWSMGHGKLEVWTEDVRSGRMPDFLQNLR